MADNRYNQAPGYHRGTPMGPGMMNMTTSVRGSYVQPNMPMNPMMQQQMMMRFPMQGMRMGPPNTPPPPYNAHQPPGIAMVNQPRATLSKNKGTHQKSEKERFFEEQRQKLRQFGKPGTKKVDTDSLIGSMFKVEAKPAVQKSKGNAKANTDDDGFGEFLQGPASDPSATPEPLGTSANSLTDAFEENGESMKESVEEKKDLTSMMLECSDLSAPQKAKGFHKPTLNEVHRPRQHDGHRRPSFHHESDHSISWKSAKDLDGLFQLPPAHTVAVPVPTQQPFHVQQMPPGQMTTATANHAFLAQGQPLPAPPHGVENVTLTSAMPNNFGMSPLPQQPLGPPPSGPPPTYGEATASPSEVMPHPAVNQTPPLSQTMPPNSMFVPPSSPSCLPEWCSYDENQVPPVYKQILEASLVDGKIATDRLYPILLLSGLPREKLAHLWSLCNTGTPGLLIKTELWLILALIALTQNNYDTSRVDILTRCPVPPIPSFSTDKNAPPNISQHQHPVPPGGDQQTVNTSNQTPSSSAIPPTHNPTIVASQSDTTMHPSAPSITPMQFQSSPLAAKGAANEATTEDDFADFQTAPTGNQTNTSSNFNGKDMQQEDSFGEFIGGGNGGSCSGASSGFGGGIATSSEIVESDPLDFPPYLPPRHCREPRTSSMGNGHLPSCPSHHSNSHQRNTHHHHPHNRHVNHDNNHNHPSSQPTLLHIQQQNMSHLQNQGYHHHGLNSNESMNNTVTRPTVRPTTLDNNVPPPLTSAGMPAALSSICLDDKYSGNVRSFFCSSDSSTGHTSPSFEDDDFTDGRDSFSQVSTSEQSEVDDIHNFEHYVEEFNHRKKEAADGSPLHCPFPSVHQNSQDKSGPTHRSIAQPSAADGTGNANQNAINADSSKFKSVQIPPPLNSFMPNALSMKSSSSSSNPVTANHNVNDEDGEFGDFADFKSASSSSTSSTTTTTAAAASQSLSADDRYGALRDLTQENDLMQSSVFETEASKTGIDPQVEDGCPDKEEDEEWANFTEAGPSSSLPNLESGEMSGAGNQNDNHFFSPSDAASSSSGTSGDVTGNQQQQQQTTSDMKEGIHNLFHIGSTSTPTSHKDGKGAMVNSDSGYSTRSWGTGINSDSTLTPTSMFDLSSPSPSGGDLKGFDTDDSKPNATETNWASFGAPKSVGASLGQSSSLPTFSMAKSEEQNGDEDWGDFSDTAMSNTSSAHASLATGVDGINFNSLDTGLGMTNPMPTTTMDIAAFGNNDKSDWASFSGVLSSQNNASAAASSDGMDDNSGNFVTIKKQNLGTNEIMGLFKVRDDPATMSAYQLPPTQTSPSSNPGKTTTGHSRKSSRRSHGRQVSSDLDDDLVPPPMDFDGDEDGDDDHAFSRGYDLDDLMQRPAPVTSYNLFGSTTSSPVYSRAVGKSTLKLKDSKEDSGSVNSLELPSTTQTFDGTLSVGGGDNQSTSSMELGTSNSGGMVSAESKSLDSLDFKTIDSPATSMDEAGKDDLSETQQQHQQSHPMPSNPHPIKPQELLASMPKLADKYNIDGGAQGNDRYSFEWERCLEQCSQVLTEANTIFNNISSSAICNEVLKSLQGWEYVSCVIEIYRVACRVMTAMRSTAISSSELEQTLKEIDLMWNNLSAFLVGASLLPDPSSLVFTSAVLKADQDPSSSSSSSSPVKTSSACGVCLLNVDVPTTTTNTSTSSSSSSLLSSLVSSSTSTMPSACVGSAITTGINSKLSFAGHNYHSTCANFWVNCVDQTLPSLVLPDLI